MRYLLIALAVVALGACTDTTGPEQLEPGIEVSDLEPNLACVTVYTEIWRNGVLVGTKTHDECDSLDEARLMDLFRSAFGDCTRLMWDVWCRYPVATTPDL